MNSYLSSLEIIYPYPEKLSSSNYNSDNSFMFYNANKFIERLKTQNYFPLGLQIAPYTAHYAKDENICIVFENHNPWSNNEINWCHIHRANLLALLISKYNGYEEVLSPWNIYYESNKSSDRLACKKYEEICKDLGVEIIPEEN